MRSIFNQRTHVALQVCLYSQHNCCNLNTRPLSPLNIDRDSHLFHLRPISPFLKCILKNHHYALVAKEIVKEISCPIFITGLLYNLHPQQLNYE